MAPICPVSAARSVSARMRSLSWTVKVRRRGRPEISGDTAAGAGTIVGLRPPCVPAPAAVSSWVSGMGMAERSYRVLKGKLPGGSCLIVIGTEGFANGRAPWLHGHYPASSLLRTQPPPSRLRPTSRFGRLYGLPCSGDFSPGRGGLLQLLGMPLSPCCRFHPAEVTSRIGQISAVHVAFALRMQARPSGILTFEATTRSLLLRPGDSWSPLGRPCR